jgi:hypothetical protein
VVALALASAVTGGALTAAEGEQPNGAAEAPIARAMGHQARILPMNLVRLASTLRCMMTPD